MSNKRKFKGLLLLLGINISMLIIGLIYGFVALGGRGIGSVAVRSENPGEYWMSMVLLAIVTIVFAGIGVIQYIKSKKSNK